MSKRLTQEKINSAARRDPLSYGIAFIDLLEDKRWEVATRAWSPQIYQAVNPWVIEQEPEGIARKMVVTKSTQAGISTAAMVKMFHFADNWPVRIFYTLPRQQDVFDMVLTRIDPMIQASLRLKSKLMLPDSAHAKRLGNSFLYFMELNTEPRMLPADMLLVDEVDLSNPDNMGTAINRLDASRWKLQMYLSTPTVPNYGIHGLYEISDKQQWMVKCPSCNYEQSLDWDINLRVKGPADKPDKVYYGCSQCDTEISIEHIQTGRWVAEHPDRSDDIVGFHVHQMLTTPAGRLYYHFRDPQSTLLEFYRKRLGKPYELSGGSITRDDFLSSCFDEQYTFEAGYDGQSTYYIGADQGNEIQLLIAKVEPHSQRRKIVHIERIPLDRGFNRLEQLINIFHVKKGVVDANPNRHKALETVKHVPGRMLLADYIDSQREVWKTRKGDIKDLPEVVSGITINRTLGMDTVMAAIKNGEYTLPGEPPRLDQDVETVIDHVTALKRDIETRKTKSGGEQQVPVYRRLRADHFAHAWLFLHMAIDLDKGRASTSRVVVIGADEQQEEQQEVIDDRKPDTDTILAITQIIAEVPKEQLLSYISNELSDDKLPFPLSFKLGKAREKYLEDNIRWVAEFLVNQKPSKISILTIDR